MTTPQNNVFAARRACGLSQEAFAALFGLTQPEINRWETGRRKPGRMVDLLMRLVLKDPEGVSEALSDLVGVKAPKVPPPVDLSDMTTGPVCDEALVHSPYVTVPLGYKTEPPESILTAPYEPFAEPLAGNPAPDEAPAPQPSVPLVLPSEPPPSRTPISFAPNSWEEADENPSTEPVSFAGDGPPPHARSGGAGAYDPDMGYMGGQEEVQSD